MPLNFFKIYRLAPFLLSSALISNTSYADSLSTTFAGGNGQNGNMFDISVTGTSSINITGFAQNFLGTSSTISGFELWTVTGGITGNTANASAWTLISSTGSFTKNTSGTPTNVPFSTPISIRLNPGQTIGIYLTNQSASESNSYTDGTGVGNVAATNANLTIYEGHGVGYPFADAAVYTPRIWNGTIFYNVGPSAADTQSSLQTLASRLRGVHNIASLISHYPNSSTYDCNLFDVKGMCISAGGRYSTVDNPNSNSTAAVVTLGYKVSPNIRIGGFLDQSVTNNNPTGIDISNKHPMMGAFAYWNQNADGLGYQVKIANAYQDKDLSTTRDVIGTSEAGRGTTSLNSRSYVGELSYAFMYKENTLVRPYFALRHTTIEQDAYTETGVTTPLTYSALNNRTTSALMGVKFKHALTPKANLIGSLGVEQDLHHKTGQLTATAAGIAGLTSENLSSDLHRTRPVASIGATYDIAKSQRLSGEVLVQQLPFQSTVGATAYFNYMIGF